MSVSCDVIESDLEAIYGRATKAEMNGDRQQAFKLYVQAAQEFLHLSRTNTNPSARAQCKAEAVKALERAEKIKGKRTDLAPIVKDHLSERMAFIYSLGSGAERIA